MIPQIIEILSKDLNCSYNNNKNWGQICELSNKESITSSLQNEQYKYIGLTEDQRKQIDFILFRTADVSFIPKETFEQFPKLKVVGFQDANIKVVTYDWIDDFTSSFEKNIKVLFLGVNSIEAIEPQVVEVFRKFDKVYLQSNNCTQSNFLTISDFTTMEDKLKVCFENFMRKYGFKVSKFKLAMDSLKRIDEKNQENLDELSNKTDTIIKNEMSAIKEIFIYIAIALVSVLVLIITTLIIGCCCFWKLLANKIEEYDRND